MAAMTGPLVAVDWGTSSLRGALIAADGTVREERSDARGILAVPAGGFPAVFEQLFGDWMRERGARCLISGMAGSKQGWVEAPYCACPRAASRSAAASSPSMPFPASASRWCRA